MFAYWKLKTTCDNSFHHFKKKEDQQGGNHGGKMVTIEKSKKSTNQHVKGIDKGVASKPHLCIYAYG